jgi:hypothetical protein
VLSKLDLDDQPDAGGAKSGAVRDEAERRPDLNLDDVNELLKAWATISPALREKVLAFTRGLHD